MTLERLNEHFELRRKLRRATENYRALTASPLQGQVMTGMPHTPGKKDKTADLGIELGELDTRIKKIQSEIELDEKDVLDFIDGIANEQTWLIFRLRFLKACEWKEVAAILGGGNSAESVKSTCYRYLSSQSCTVVLRDDAP